MNKLRIGLMLLSIGLLTACNTPRHAAPVYERTAGSRPVEAPRAQPRPDVRGMYTIRKGDTLHRIASEQGVSYRDLIAWNGITNPNDIKVDQVLRLTPPDNSAAGSAQAGAIPSASPVEVRPLNAPGAPAVNGDRSAAVLQKNSPRGDKRPYSEAILADLQKPEVRPDPAVPGPVASLPSPTVPKSLPKGNEARAHEKAGPAAAEPSLDDEGIAWIWPAEGKIIATFDEGKSKGIDIAGKIGQQVVAAGAGKVMYAGSGIRGYGNLVIVKHTNNLLSAYAHNHSILVKEGQSVSKGQKIAEMGKSDADAVKLHFEIRRQGKPVDPSKFLPSR